MTHIDRRSSRNNKPHDDRGDAETRALTDAQESVPTVTLGSNRRVLPGARTATDFFAPERINRSLSRGDLMHVLATLEFARAERTWWRRLYRWWHHLPQVADMPYALSTAHARSLREAVTKLGEAAADAQ